MKIIFPITALALVGCSAGASDQSLYDLPTEKYNGNGGSTSAPDTPNGNGMDASVCKVQGSASVTGVTLAAKDAIELFDATKAKFTFLITDYASACSYGEGVHAGSSVISIAYAANALKSGTYDVASTPSLVAKYVKYDATCKPTTSVTAASGNVTFDRLDDCGGVGSFDLVFGSSHVTASFTASVCALSGGEASCK